MCSQEVSGGSFCHKCGSRLPQSVPVVQTAPQQYYPQAPSPYPTPIYPYATDHTKSARNWAVASVALGFASILLFMIVFAPLSIVCGTISLTKLNQRNNLAIVGIALALIGIIGGWFTLVILS